MTDQQKQEALRLYKAGVKLKNIIKLTGLTFNQIDNFIYKNLKLRSRNHKYKVSDLNLIKSLRLQGKKEREILDLTGLKRSQLRYLLHSNGVGLRDFDYI